MTDRPKFAVIHSSVFLRLIVARIGQAILSVFGVSILVWALLPLAEGDTAERVLKARGTENPSSLQIQAVREEFGLDKSLPVQYFEWLKRAVRGDFSVSYESKRPVLTEIAERAPATALLAAVALFLALGFSISAALLSAAFHGRLPDRSVQFLCQATSALPAFLLGLLILRFIVVGLGVGTVVTDFSVSGSIFPAFCLAFALFGGWTQVLRTELVSGLSSGYAMVARARGATRRRLLWRYALPNALVPFLTVVGLGFGGLLGGTAIIETVFSWNGIGLLAVRAVAARDLPVVQAFVIFATLAYIGANLAVDLAAMWLDPRLRRPQSSAQSWLA